jgi:hypothetical protein
MLYILMTTQMNLIQFSRLYTIGGVPFFDFIVVYIALYVANSLYLHWDYRSIIFITIPIVVIIDYLVDNNVEMSYSTAVVATFMVGLTWLGKKK